MKVIYFDCNMGAAGDMLSGALLELVPEEERPKFIEELNALGLPGVEFAAVPSVKCGITGTHMKVTVNGQTEGEEHHHLPEKVKSDILEVYGLIARAESHAHGVPVTEIHFHEVGTMDAVADVTAVCLLMDRLAPERVIVSPVHVGSGQVRCAHGILPVPAPATAHILTGVPIYGGKIKGELCTPTGAALLRHFADSFGDMPVMTLLRVGYGMGTKDFEAANLVRAMLGEA